MGRTDSNGRHFKRNQGFLDRVMVSKITPIDIQLLAHNSDSLICQNYI